MLTVQRHGTLLTLLLVLVVSSAILNAQDGGAAGVLSGRVADQSGAKVAGAAVRLISRQSGESVLVSTSRNGEFSAASLRAGVYDLSVEAPGFATLLRSGVVLGVGETLNLDLVVKISAVGEQISVTAKAPAGELAIETSPTNTLEVLEIREVRESAAKDVGEAIANLDGVWKVRKAGIANDVVVRGFQRGNIDVLIDGMRIYEACPSQMDPAAYHVDFAEIQTVDVGKGPYNIRDQGSLGGTVNVVGKEPAPGFTVTPNLSMGSFGFYNPSWVMSGSKGRIHALAGYSYRRSDPYVTGSGRKVTDYANFTPAGANNAAFDSHAGWARVGVDLARNQSVQFLYGRQVDGLTQYPGLSMDALSDTTDRFNVNWSLRELTGAVKTLRAQAYLTQVKQWMSDQFRTSAVGAPLGYNMGTFSGTRALGGRSEMELSNMVVGLEVYDRGWSVNNWTRQGMTSTYNNAATLPDVRMIVGGVYTQVSHTFGRMHISVAGRVDASSSAAQARNLGPATDLYWAYQNTRSTSAADANPSGHVKLTYLLPKGIEFFAGSGSSVRLPDPEERYYAAKKMATDWVGNPRLAPTRNNEADTGIALRSRYFSLRPTLFYSRLSDFIVVSEQPKINSVMGIMNTSARSYQGVDARLYGGELSYSVEFSRSLLLAGGFSYTRGIQYAKPEAGLTRGPVAEMPPLKSRASLRYGKKLFFAEANGIASARQNQVNTFLREQPTAGFLIAGFKTGIHHKKWNVSLGLNNLTNRFYYEFLSFQRDPDRTGVRVPEPGRTFHLNIAANF